MKLPLLIGLGSALCVCAWGQTNTMPPGLTPEQQEKWATNQARIAAMLQREHSNMVALVELQKARAVEREAWRASNAARFGTNWQAIVFGTNSATNMPPVRPPLVFYFNADFFKDNPTEFAESVARKRNVISNIWATHGYEPEVVAEVLREYDDRIRTNDPSIWQSNDQINHTGKYRLTNSVTGRPADEEAKERFLKRHPELTNTTLRWPQP